MVVGRERKNRIEGECTHLGINCHVMCGSG